MTLTKFLYLFLTPMIFCLGFQPKALALDVYFEQMPDGYRVFQWDSKKENVKAEETYKSEQFRRIRFSIPDQFVERDASGNINITKTFENWRTGTDSGFMLPKTYAPGLARFPFTIDNGSLDARAPARNVYYMSAQEMLQNVEKNELRFGTLNDEDRLYVENLGLIDRLNSISQSKINCRGGRNSVAAWSPEKCLMCNCFNEALVSDTRGQTLIAQVVFRRVVSKGFPLEGNRDNTQNNICGIISEPSQFSWIGNPSKPEIKSNSEYMKNCKSSTIEAIRVGPGIYDHFHTTAVNPAWRSQSKESTGVIGGHYFHRVQQTNDDEAADLNAEFNSSAGEQVFRPLQAETTVQPQQINDENPGTE